MGQQQFLILTLTIVIVGMAFYVGTDVFNRSARQRHADMLMSHAVHVASDAITWRSKTSSFLGGGDSYTGMTMDRIRVDEHRIPGIVRITYAQGDSLVITAASVHYEDIGIRVHISGTEIARSDVSFTGEITLPGEAVE